MIDRTVAAHVEIHFGIELVDVDRAMQTAGAQLEQAGHGFDRRRRPAAVPEHGLGRVDAQPLGMGAEHALDRPQLGEVAERCRGGVRIDVTHVFRTKAGAGNHLAHNVCLAVLRRLRQVVAVGIGRAPEHLGIDTRAAALCGVELFEHERRAAMRGHEAFTAGVVRPACARGIVVEVLEGDRSHQGHRMHVDRRELEDGADDHRDLRAVVPDLVHRRAQRHVAAGAGGAHRVDRSTRLQNLRHATGVVGVERIERRHAVDEVGLFLELDAAVELIQRVEVVAGHDHRLAMRIVIGVEQPGVPPAIGGQQHRQLRRPWHSGHELAQAPVHVGRDERFKRGQLRRDVVARQVAADLAVDALGRKRLPLRDGRTPGHQRVPEAIERVTDRGVHAHAGDDDPLMHRRRPRRSRRPPACRRARPDRSRSSCNRHARPARTG